MAEDVLGKTVKQLKKERIAAKTSFTRQANFITREADSMLEMELKEEFAKLSDSFRMVLEANDDYKTGLLADKTKSEDKEEAVLEKQQEGDIERTATEAETKFGEVRDIVQTNLWSRYGESEIEIAILEADKACTETNNVPVQSTNLESYDVFLTLLEKRINEATTVMSTWERWIPVSSKQALKNTMKNLRAANNKLELRKAEFVTARRIAEQESPTGAPGGGRALPTPAPPIVRIKPTTLPVFHGSKRDYHR